MGLCFHVLFSETISLDSTSIKPIASAYTESPSWEKNMWINSLPQQIEEHEEAEDRQEEVEKYGKYEAVKYRERMDWQDRLFFDIPMLTCVSSKMAKRVC